MRETAQIIKSLEAEVERVERAFKSLYATQQQELAEVERLRGAIEAERLRDETGHPVDIAVNEVLDRLITALNGGQSDE